MPLKSVCELVLEVPTPDHLGRQLAAQQVGLWVPAAGDVQPKQLVRLRVCVGGVKGPSGAETAKLTLIGEILEIERAGRGRGARVQLGPSGWARLRAVLYDCPP